MQGKDPADVQLWLNCGLQSMQCGPCVFPWLEPAAALGGAWLDVKKRSPRTGSHWQQQLWAHRHQMVSKQTLSRDGVGPGRHGWRQKPPDLLRSVLIKAFWARRKPPRTCPVFPPMFFVFYGNVGSETHLAVCWKFRFYRRRPVGFRLPAGCATSWPFLL